VITLIDRCVGVGLSTVLRGEKANTLGLMHAFILSALGCDVPSHLDSPVMNVD
jgi:NAD(P)H-hydrate repair Nnr-like enzyme with NAD(P)H-hydrate epimerase domain